MECLNCKKEFIPTNPNQHYCSNACYKEYQKVLRKKREEKNKWFVCSECWKEYRTFRWDNQWRLCKECIEKKSICQCWNKKSPWARYCKKCWYKYQKEFVCLICWKTCWWNSNQKICDDCEPICMLPWCNNKIPDYRHRAKTNNLNSLMFCCKQHYYRYEKEVWFPEWSPLWNQRQRIWDQEFTPFWQAAAKPRIKWLEDNWIEYETQFKLKNNIWLSYSNKRYKDWIWQSFPNIRRYDIKVWNLLIEISPTVSHNSTYWYPYNKKYIWQHPLYHTYTQMLAEANWYHCIQIFDFDDKNKIKSWLLWLIKWRKSINARIVKPITYKEWNEFCEQNHLQWKTSATTKVRYWLFRSDNDKPYAVMWFKFEKWDWTLQRFACLEWYHIPYWAHRLFKQFIKDYNPDYIISQSDSSKHNWKLYDSLWFERMWRTRDYWRYNIEHKKYYRRRNCQKKKAYKLPWFEQHPKWDIYYSTHTEQEVMKDWWYVRLVTAWLISHVRFKNEEWKIKYLKSHKPKDERKQTN